MSQMNQKQSKTIKKPGENLQKRFANRLKS